MTEKEMREWAQKKEKEAKLWSLIDDLYAEVADFDDGVKQYFDLESMEMPEKKAKVLSALADGKSPEEIGKDYFDILEGFDQSAVPEGQIAMVGDWEFDPEKYK